MSFEITRALSLIPVAAAVAQLRFVTVGANGEIDQTGAGGDAQGVTLEASPATDQVAISVAVLDGATVDVESGAAVVAGADIMSDSTGKAITATATPVTNVILGKAMSVSGATGQIITVLISKKGGGQAIS